MRLSRQAAAGAPSVYRLVTCSVCSALRHVVGKKLKDQEGMQVCLCFSTETPGKLCAWLATFRPRRAMMSSCSVIVGLGNRCQRPLLELCRDCLKQQGAVANLFAF